MGQKVFYFLHFLIAIFDFAMLKLKIVFGLSSENLCIALQLFAVGKCGVACGGYLQFVLSGLGPNGDI